MTHKLKSCDPHHLRSKKVDFLGSLTLKWRALFLQGVKRSCYSSVIEYNTGRPAIMEVSAWTRCQSNSLSG